ncbi:YfhO family protein [Weissella confusa]|uniref:Membrane protein 6-pyruvoyl-tetrahydropterin synthase-related domain-containing protein n=1 Tax=Limosilactobacillus reuteri TaxID=1598 RepID=A0A2T5Q3V7_LIMRT|nr:YfhO family protein [Limosilactobacillus reuteri]MCW3763736.1 YfhO family protein [Weissella confusa]PTV04118.1 hypothetical protein DB325_04785 [Limosilactobacillus reuteri]
MTYIKIRKKTLLNILILSSFIILSLVFCLPFMKTGTIYYGDDMYYHLERINELIRNAKNGNIFVGIYTYTFEKVGYPLNLFYPWITLLPFVFIYNLVKNLTITVYLGISFYTFLTLVFTNWTTFRYCQNKTQSFVTACIYAFCSYRVIDAFARFALGEFIAMTFLPLVTYGAYAIIKGNYKDWPFLAFGISFVLLSHLLSTLIYVLFLAILGIVIFLGTKQFNNIKIRILSLFKAIIVAITSSSIFLFPFLEQILFQKFQQPSKLDMVEQALVPSKLLECSINNIISRTVNGNVYNIGFTLVFVIILGIMYYRKIEQSYRMVFILAIIFFFASTSLLPWVQIEKTPISFIQFPWRFLVISSFLLSIVGGYEFTLITQNKNKILSVFVMVFLILIPWYSGISDMRRNIDRPDQYKTYHYVELRNNRFKYSYGAEKTTKYMIYLDQYTPKKGLSTLNVVRDHYAMIDSKMVKLNKIKSAGSNKLEYISDRFRDSKNIILPMYVYRNLQIVNGNGEKIPFTTSKNSQIKINNSLSSNKIIVQYKLSNLDICSIILSLGTWVFGVVVFLKRLFQKHWKVRFQKTKQY